MLDLHFVRENFDQVREKLSTRNFDPALLEDFQKLDGERRALIRERDELNAASNRISKEVGALMREGKKEEAEGKKAESRQIGEQIKGIETKLNELEEGFNAILQRIPNLPHESVPLGKDEAANAELSEYIADRIRRRVRDPKVAEKLIPRDHGFGVQRLPLLPLSQLAVRRCPLSAVEEGTAWLAN